MGTEYNALDDLFSSIKVEENEQHTKVTLFIDGKNIGTLCCGKEDRTGLLHLFFTIDIGKGGDLPRNGLSRTRSRLSEYGEVQL